MNQKESILIVDDNKNIRNNLMLIFNKKGYQVDTAKSAREALKKAYKKYFNIVLIEYELPDMEGSILLGKLKEIHPKITCFIVTTYAFLQNVRNVVRNNADGYFIKPLIIEDVLYRIEKILKEQRMEEKLKESEEKYRAVFENTGTAMIIVEEDTIISMVNSQFEKISGYSKDEIENKIKWTDFVVPEDLKRMKKYHIARRKAGENPPTEYEFRFIDKKGNMKNILVKVALISGSKKVVASLIDITSRKQTEENIKRSRDELQLIMDSVPAMIYYKDTKNRIIRANKTLAKSLKIPVKNLIGKTTEELFSRKQSENMKKDDEEVIISGKTKKNIIQPDTTSDGIRWLITDKIPYRDKEGKVIGVISLSKDITKEKQIEDKLQDYLKQIKQDRKNLKRLSKKLINVQEEERRKISVRIHDDIGQNIAALKINMSVIEEAISKNNIPKIKEKLTETKSLLNYTFDKLSKLSVDLHSSLLEDLGLLSAFRDYVSRYKKRENIDIDFEIVNFKKRLNKEMEIVIFRTVQEAFTNISKHACADNIYLRLENKKSKVLVLIKDNGKGFNLKNVKDLEEFDKGLGLIEMRERIETIGGHLEVKSSLGEGTQVLIEIPLVSEG